MTIELTDEQQAAFDAVVKWRRKGGKQLSLGGYAGTGKTTLVQRLIAEVPGRVRVATPTGKAALVLRMKGVEDASTIHSLLYAAHEYCGNCEAPPPCTCGNPEYTTSYSFRPMSEGERPDWIIIDEASMVANHVYNDIMELGIPVLFVGDHGQLEPIGGNPGLMLNPDIRLETVHRFGEGSDIALFAQHLREGNQPRSFGENASCYSEPPGGPEDYDAIICGFNRTRIETNQEIRESRGFEGQLPLPGDVVICLRNYPSYGFVNGEQAVVTDIYDDDESFDLKRWDGSIVEEVQFEPRQFHAPKLTDVAWDDQHTLWDFGYCLTAHKAQGSEWDRVLVIEELSPGWTASRWRYTAATRARKRLDYVVRRGRR